MTPPGDDAGPLFRKAEQAHPAGYQNVHVASIHSLCHAAAIFGKKTRFFNRLVCAVKNSFLRRPQLQPALTLSGSVASGWNLMGLNLDSFNRGGRGRHVDVIPSKITTWSGRDVTQEKYKTSSFGTSAVCRLFTFFKIRNSRSKAAHPNFPYKLILMNVNAPLNFNSIKSHSLKIKSLFPLYKLN